MKDLSASISEAVLATYERSGRTELTAAFAVEKWLSGFFSLEEMDNFRSVEKELAIEVSLSRDPSAVLYSDPGRYAYRSRIVELLVQERFQKHGQVIDLAADPIRQHLVELSAPSQHLRYVLQNKFGAASSEANSLAMVQSRAKRDEIDRKREEICRLIEGASFIADPKPLFLKSLALQVPEENSGALMGSSCASIEFGEGMKLHLEVLCEINSRPSSKTISGYMSMIVRGAGMEVGKKMNDGTSLIFFPQALPNKFDCYRNFVGRDELALSCMAWAYAAATLLNSVKRSFPEARACFGSYQRAQ